MEGTEPDSAGYCRRHGRSVGKPVRYYYFARPDRLLLDLDGPRAWATFRNAWAYLQDTDLFKSYRVFRSPGGNRHVAVQLNKNFGPGNRIALQALLGSDLKRERYHLRRIERQVPNPILWISFRRYPGLSVDYTCPCPRTWKGKRLRSCYHLRRDIQPGDRP